MEREGFALRRAQTFRSATDRRSKARATFFGSPSVREGSGFSESLGGRASGCPPEPLATSCQTEVHDERKRKSHHSG